ncbi:hypothetical protein BG011_004664 [Mortierella polycephala]|uniref:Uncharacterized protein n=1 Tax=Mortierella polycephala TaxID=41804 RepID=A0A9P6U9M2_9FUNG|nr:hypothetical protein BG011_004664 [Mortierella polycephala]
MSTPQDQPAYYSPAPAAASPVGQYVQPSPVGQYAQPTPDQINQQQQQPYYAEQPVQIQPAVVATTQHTSTDMPVVLKGNGRGIVGKMPQFNNCCICFPLHTGAMIIAFLLVIFYGYCGLVLLVSSSYSGWYSAVVIVLGIIYLLIAFCSAYGFAGIYKEEPAWVDRFIKMFLIGSLLWALLEIIEMIILVVWYNKLCNSYVSQYFSCGFPWASWIIIFILGAGFQYYFCCCLVSYQRALHARISDVNGGGIGSFGGKDIQMQ